jgi:hypothetical protein
VECRLIIESTDRWKWVEDCYSQAKPKDLRRRASDDERSEVYAVG